MEHPTRTYLAVLHPQRTYMRSFRQYTKRRMRAVAHVALLRLFAFALLGCQAAPNDPEPDEAPVELAPEGASAVVVASGWDCADIEQCLGLEDNRHMVFERTVGKRSTQEDWQLVNRVEADGVVTWTQAGGPSVYELHGPRLMMSFRGELLEAMRFPVEAGDSFTVTSVSGQPVKMRIEETNVPAETPGGSWERCLLHEARFINAEEPKRGGLRIRTTFCEGIGEVRQQIQLPSMPHPVEIVLVESNQS